MESDVRSTLGKHMRSSQDIIIGQQTEHAQSGAIRIPSARKRLKMDPSMLEEDLTVTLPSASDAALPLPTEHAQMDTSFQSASGAKKYETGKKQAFSTAEWDELDDKKQPLSLTRRIVR